MNLEQLSDKIANCARAYDKSILVEEVSVGVKFPKDKMFVRPVLKVLLCCYYLAKGKPPVITNDESCPHQYFEVSVSKEFDMGIRFDFDDFFHLLNEFIKNQVDHILTKDMLDTDLSTLTEPKE